jgi:3-phosphoshikimate 1-carboxyvinyltransferase
VEIIPPFESKPYVDLTLDALRNFGADVGFTSEYKIEIKPATLHGLSSAIEGDYSNAAFLDAFNLIGGRVEVLGLNASSLQGDRVYVDFYKRLACGFDTYDLADCPDLAPVLFALAALLHGAEFINTRRLKIKESDRAEAMREELSKVGCDIVVEENRVIVPKTTLHIPTSPISSHNDHRIAMAMSIVLSVLGGEIEGAEAVAKSFPDYFKTLTTLQIGIEYYA